MKKRVYFPGITTPMEGLLFKWERVITVLVALCAVIAIVLGTMRLFLGKDALLFAVLGFSSCYFIGRSFWRFRSQGLSAGN
ncbi:MAG TPA: hypothetical protein VMV04_07970 [Thermodesulfobacteriota bacterium]|nr:hypothetical protein [Thermodesulfobacteriota bacterium]